MILDFFKDISYSDILTKLLDFLYFLLDFLFGWINLPQMPSDLVNSIDNFINLIFNNLGILGFFVRPTTFKILIPLIIFVVNFKYIYKFIIWFIRKLPFININ